MEWERVAQIVSSFVCVKIVKSIIRLASRLQRTLVGIQKEARSSALLLAKAF